MIKHLQGRTNKEILAEGNSVRMLKIENIVREYFEDLCFVETSENFNRSLNKKIEQRLKKLKFKTNCSTRSSDDSMEIYCTISFYNEKRKWCILDFCIKPFGRLDI